MSCISVRIRILSLLFAPFRGASCFKSAKTSANTDKTNKTIQHIRTFVPLKSLKSLAGPKQCNTWFRQVALDWTCWVRWLQRFSRKRRSKRGDMRKDMIPVISSAKMNWRWQDDTRCKREGWGGLVSNGNMTFFENTELNGSPSGNIQK